MAGAGDRSWHGKDKGRWIEAIPGPKGSDRSVIEIERWGAYMPDVIPRREVKSVVRDNHKAHFEEPSTSDTILRPWIYGSVRMSSLKPFHFSLGATLCYLIYSPIRLRLHYLPLISYW